MSRFAIGTDFPKTISFVCAKRNGGKAVPAFRGQVSPGGEFLFARTKRNQKCAGGQARRNFKRQGRALVPSACTPGPLVLAKSAQLHFRLTAKIPFAPMLLLSPPNPLRWALVGLLWASQALYRGPQALLLWHASAAAAQGAGGVLTPCAINRRAHQRA